MRKPSTLLPLSLLTAGFAITVANAQDAHVHGEAILQLVIDDTGALATFQSPAANIVGFERQPESDSQKQTVADAISQLSNFPALFTLPTAAGCTVDDAHADFEVEAAGADHDDHDEDEMKAGADHDDHDEDEMKAEAGHAEFHAEFELTCANTSNLTSLQTNLFDLFPSLEALEVKVVTPSGQAGAELTPQNPEMAL